jgi:hypothetical protein
MQSNRSLGLYSEHLWSFRESGQLRSLGAAGGWHRYALVGNNSDPTVSWTPSIAVSKAANGNACLIQSTIVDIDESPGNLEAIVVENGFHHAPNSNPIVHYNRVEAGLGVIWNPTHSTTKYVGNIQSGSLM